MLVGYCRLCRHCRNLAKWGCLLSRFHFTRCRYFLGHVPCRNLPWQGLKESKQWFYLELSIFPRSMLFQGDLPLNICLTNKRGCSCLIVRQACSAAILKGKCHGKRYSASCNIPLSVLFLSFTVIFCWQRREPFIREHSYFWASLLYMLWFNFFLGLNFLFFRFKLIIMWLSYITIPKNKRK